MQAQNVPGQSNATFAIAGPLTTNFIFFPDKSTTVIYLNDPRIHNKIAFSIGVSASLFGLTGVVVAGVVSFTISVCLLNGSVRTQVIQVTPVQIFQSRMLSYVDVESISISATSTVAADTAATVSATLNGFVIEQ